MIGIKISVATSIIPRVRWLETLSQTVRLDPKSVEEGMMNGNIDTPAVPMTPIIVIEDAMKPSKVFPRLTNNIAVGAMTYTSSGSNVVRGYR